MMNRNRVFSSSRGTRAASAAIALCASLLFFFRHPISNGFTALYGASYDAIIEVAILNHWFNALTQGADWKTTSYFYPYVGTLGYNDTYVIPGLFFTAARLAGLDPFLATFASYVGMKAIGFSGMYMLLRRGLRISHVVTLFGSVLFTIAGATLLQLTHGQLLSLGLVPWLSYLLIETLKALRNGRTRPLILSGIACASLFAISALNAFYFIWFFCFFVLIALRVLVGLTPFEQRKVFFHTARQRAVPLAGIALFGGLALTPFLATYLPKLSETGGHAWWMVAGLLPTPATLFNVGPGNMLWGGLNEWLYPGQTYSTEDQVGFGPFTLAAIVGAVLWAHRHRSRTDAQVVVALACALALILLLSLRVGEFSLWRAIYEVVPAAGSVRAVTRFYLFALVPITVILALWLEQLRNSARPMILGAAMGLLLLEQVQLAPPLYLNRGEQLRMLSSVPAPPPVCEAFFVVAARPAAPAKEAFPSVSSAGHLEFFGMYRHNVDAMLLASYHNKPTIIGFSSFNPPDWQFADPWKPDYLHRVRNYAQKHGVEPLCGYDYRRSSGWFILRH